MKHLLERIGRYSNGCIATNKGNIQSHQALSIYVKEIDPDYNQLKKTDFATINENKSYSTKDFA